MARRRDHREVFSMKTQDLRSKKIIFLFELVLARTMICQRPPIGGASRLSGRHAVAPSAN
jgi:hypothetical protein